jgi:hypothetical protein
MAIYKFRVTFEDYEDITRDIEIKSSQTFFDFFQIILQSIEFDSKHAASFFVSDDYWSKKGAEITLLEEDVEPGVKLMKNTKIASYIEQPNQRFVFLYDKDVCWTLLIELIKLVPESPKATYPQCIKTVGKPPKQYKQKLIEKLKEEVEKGEIDDKIPDEETGKKIIDEKLVFDENEEHELEEDESELVAKGGDEELVEGEESEDDEISSEHEEHEGDEKW